MFVVADVRDSPKLLERWDRFGPRRAHRVVRSSHFLVLTLPPGGSQYEKMSVRNPQPVCRRFGSIDRAQERARRWSLRLRVSVHRKACEQKQDFGDVFRLGIMSGSLFILITNLAIYGITVRRAFGGDTSYTRETAFDEAYINPPRLVAAQSRIA